MPPLEYVTAAVLAQHKDSSIEEGALKKEVIAFLEARETKAFGWHMGLSGRVLDDADTDRKREADWFEDSIAELKKNGFLSKDGSKVSFKEKNITWAMNF